MALLRLRPSPLSCFTPTLTPRPPRLQLSLLPCMVSQLCRQWSCKQKSTGPVRYIPKSRNSQDSEKPSTVGKGTDSFAVTERSPEVHRYTIATGTEKEGSSTSTSRNSPDRIHRLWKKNQADYEQEETDALYCNHKQVPGTVENSVLGKAAIERGHYFSHSHHGLRPNENHSLPRTSSPTEQVSLEVVQDLAVSQASEISIPEQIQTGQGRVQLSQLPLYPPDVDQRAGRPQDVTPNEKAMNMAYNEMMNKTHSSDRAKNNIHQGDDGVNMRDGSQGCDDIVHEPFSDDQIERIRKAEVASNAARVDAKYQAVRLLAMRPLTAFQLKKKLGLRKVFPELIDLAVADMQSCGMQNDGDYAETFARSRWSGQSWGPQKIKQALTLRGVSEENIRTALQHVFQEDGEQDFTGEQTHGISKLVKEQLMIQARKQWNRARDIPEGKRVQRLIRWLQYRGFNWAIIQDVLKFLQMKRP